MREEVFVSVDVEASGPSPSTGSLVAIGACLVDDESRSFYAELRPIDGLPWDAAAERVHRLSREHLAANATTPRDAMRTFAAWVEAEARDRQPIFVGFNAPFDWMFVADYLHRFAGRNPFGISALDLKAYYMGRHRVGRWGETTKTHVLARHPVDLEHTHHALEDARAQARLMRALREG